MGRIWDNIKRFGSKVWGGVKKVGAAVGKALRPVANVVKKVTNYTSYIPGTIGKVSGAINTILKAIWKDDDQDSNDADQTPSKREPIKAIGYEPRGGHNKTQDGVARNPIIVEPNSMLDRKTAKHLTGMGPLGKNLAGQATVIGKPNPNAHSTPIAKAAVEPVTNIYRR